MSSKEYARQYRLTHKAELLAHERSYRETHRKEFNERARAYKAKYPDRVKASLEKYHASIQAYSKKHYRDVKAAAIAAYGSRCACCGEAEFCFLTIDHINNDGNRHRSQPGSATGYAIYRWLKKEGYPKGQFQVLCWNCNCAKVHSQEEHERIHPNAKEVNGNRPALFF